MYKRLDKLTALKVDLALSLLAARGMKNAAAYLARERVDLHIALRVLTRPPAVRREADRQDPCLDLPEA